MYTSDASPDGSHRQSLHAVQEMHEEMVPIHGSGRSTGGSGKPLPLFPRLEYLIDRGVWQTTVYRVTKSDITEHGMACV